MTNPEAPVRSDSFRPVLGATVLLVLALLSIAALKSYRDLAAAQARERGLQAQIHDTHARCERLKVRIDRLRHDPGMLERLAREDLGMVRPGDVVVELPGQGDAQSPHPPSSSPVPSLPPSPGEGVAVPTTTVIPAAGSAGPSAPPAAAVPAVAGPPGPG